MCDPYVRGVGKSLVRADCVAIWYVLGIRYVIWNYQLPPFRKPRVGRDVCLRAYLFYLKSLSTNTNRTYVSFSLACLALSTSGFSDPKYMSRKIRKFRTDKFDSETNGNFDSCNSCKRLGLYHVSNLFRFFLLMYTGSMIGRWIGSGTAMKLINVRSQP